MEPTKNCIVIQTLMQQLLPKYNKTTTIKFSSLNITPSQAEILFLLEEKGPQKISEIASNLKMVDSNVSNICSRLEKAQYIERKRQKEDQRIVKIELLESAFPKIKQLREENKLFYKRMSQLISQEEVAEICDGLEKLDHLFDKLIEVHQEEGESVYES